MGKKRSGTVALNNDALTHALGLRGINGAQLAQIAGITEPTVSRARRGYPVFPSTIRKIANALAKIPIIDGSEALVALPPNLKGTGSG